MHIYMYGYICMYEFIYVYLNVYIGLYHVYIRMRMFIYERAISAYDDKFH